MSSEVEAGGIVVAAVALPAAVAFGAGWLAWQGGKLFIEANRAVDRQIAEKKRELEEAARHRKMAAVAAHGQLVDMCSQILSQLDCMCDTGHIVNFAEIEQLKYDLKEICEEKIPDDTAQIESLTSLGYLKLDKIVRQQSHIASLKLSDSEVGLYRGLSLADLMDDLRIAIDAMNIKSTNGIDVKAADPEVLERVKLNDQFAEAIAEIMNALEFVDDLKNNYGLTVAGSNWFHSCFNGIDTLIATLCSPTTTNKELKKGIRRLQDVLEQYNALAPSIEKEVKKMISLYEVYVDASKALGEKIESIKSFNSSAQIEEKLIWLQSRAKKAQECAEIYEKLGPAAYLCYAWDQELKELGYEVHTRQKITEMASEKPRRATLGENKLPFYQWDEDDLTQLYSITSECALQVIIHDDGTVSMQTIADSNSESVVEVQHSHCSRLKLLHERLRKNWFILYDYEETESPDKVTTIANWRASKNHAWRGYKDETIMEQRSKSTEKVKQMQ